MKILKQHVLLSILLPLCIFSAAFSYYRFMIAGDYVVAYEAECDPIARSCFYGYDEETQEGYYYTKIQKYARDVYTACGPDITDCAAANICLVSDGLCSITYCSPEAASEDESCEGISASAMENSQELPEEEIESARPDATMNENDI